LIFATQKIEIMSLLYVTHKLVLCVHTFLKYFTYHLTTQNEALSYEHSTRRYEYNCVFHAVNQVVVRILLEEGKTQ
jgi:hypothetical protein